MATESLSRIPFSVEDELMIASMARWMGFMGRFIIIVSILGVFFILLGLVFSLLILTSGGELFEKMGPFGQFLNDNKATLAVLMTGMLLLNCLQLAAGYYLFWASRDFDNVARTDQADQDFLASGLTRLKTTAKISTTVAVFQLLVNIFAGMALVGVERLST